jgi:hypothetical protein
MFKYKITIVLKSGYEIRVRGDSPDYEICENEYNDDIFLALRNIPKKNFSFCCLNTEIAAIIIKHWYQRWA